MFRQQREENREKILSARFDAIDRNAKKKEEI